MKSKKVSVQESMVTIFFAFVFLLVLISPVKVTAADIQIPNNSFENGFDHWEINGEVEASMIEENGYESEHALKHSSGASFETTTSQKLTGLDNGYYTLTAWTKSSGGQNASYIFAETTNRSKAMTSVPVSENWVKTIVRGVEVSDGQINIGLHSNGNKQNWTVVDRFELEKTDKSYKLLKGGDVSELTHLESFDAKYYDQNNVEKDMFQILKENGHDIVRLRVYNDPGKGRGDGEWYRQEGFLNKEDVLKLAKRAKSVGLQIQLTFHYSDYWSNGSVQNVPEEWQEQIVGLSEDKAVEKLGELLHDYTKDVMQAMKDQGTTPEYVSLGNEMQKGILYPYGSASTSNWDNLALLLNAGAAAVEEVDPSSKIILHLDGAGEYEKYYDFFDHAEEAEVDYDIIGSSYYPFWSKITVDEVTDFYNEISGKYDKDIMVMETGFNWNPTLPDSFPGQLTDNGPYPLSSSTPEGQKNYLIELFNGLKNVDQGRVIGVLYWDPIMIDQPGVGWAINEETDQVGKNVVSNTTLFDFDGKALKAHDAFKFNANGAENGHIRGVVKGTDGNRIPYAEVSTKIKGKVYATQADRNGNYLISDLPKGKNYKVTAKKTGYKGNNATVKKVVAGEFSDLDIILKGGAVAGTVTDNFGKPAKDTTVSVTIDDIQYSTFTDELGDYTLGDLPEGNNYDVSAEKEGYDSDSQAGININIGKTVFDLDFVVTLSSGTVSGSVIDTEHTPIEGAVVRITVGKKVFSATTDNSGNYKILNVPEGSNYKVVASKDNYIAGEITGVDVITGENTEVGDITIDSNVGLITGTVKDSKGNPITDGKVTASSGTAFYHAETNASGEFTFEDVLAGEYALTAEKEGYISGVESSVIVNAKKTTSDINLRVGDPIEVPNFSFENPGKDWMISNESATNMIHHPAVYDGDLVLSSFSENAYQSDVHQTITGLENGHYTLTVQAYNGGGQNEYYMYAKDTGGEEVRKPIPPTGVMTPITLNVEVTGGQMTIGFYSDAKAGNWSLLDVVQLGYRGK
jgi:arabinogalactan endo-1,4-beta-galactosidase